MTIQATCACITPRFSIEDHMNCRKDLTQKRVQDLLHYDLLTGVFTWLQDRGGDGAKKGDIAGHVNKVGYVIIKINCRAYKAHRLAWLWVYGEWPKLILDHIDTVKYHNWITNLREATHSQNCINRGKNVNNSSGYKGVSYIDGKYVAYISCKMKRITIGRYTTPEEAHKAYCDKADELFGEFANHGTRSKS